jgi:hypothetical protein
VLMLCHVLVALITGTHAALMSVLVSALMVAAISTHCGSSRYGTGSSTNFITPLVHIKNTIRVHVIRPPTGQDVDPVY